MNVNRGKELGYGGSLSQWLLCPLHGQFFKQQLTVPLPLAALCCRQVIMLPSLLWKGLVHLRLPLKAQEQAVLLFSDQLATLPVHEEEGLT